MRPLLKVIPLKTKVLHSIFLFASAFVLFSFSDPFLVKRISDKDFRYEFYTTSKKIKLEEDKVYYWFKGGIIHNAQSGVAGELLEGDFTKMYHSNQLAEQGKFKKGLKTGLWKSWYENGKLSSVQNWKAGLKSGSSIAFDNNGEVIEKGKYMYDKKEGTWINHIKKDTLVFKKGIVFVKEKKLSKEEKIQLKEEKKKKEELIKAEKANSSNKRKVDKEIKGKTQNDTARQSFMKRIFSKKGKENKNDKGA